MLALLVHGVLLKRYALYFHLLRLDMVALWLFVTSSAVVLFGLRPVTRFVWVWLLLLMVFPLPYYLTVIVLGGNRVAGGAATLLIAAFATAIGVGRTVRRAVIGSMLAWGVGFAALFVMAVFFPDAPLLAYQQIPALTAILLVGVVLYLYRRRGEEKHFLDRKIEPLAAGQVWVGLPLVFAVAVVLSTVKLPVPPTPPTTEISSMTFATPPLVPDRVEDDRQGGLHVGPEAVRQGRNRHPAVDAGYFRKPAVGQVRSAAHRGGGQCGDSASVVVRRCTRRR